MFVGSKREDFCPLNTSKVTIHQTFVKNNSLDQQENVPEAISAILTPPPPRIFVTISTMYFASTWARTRGHRIAQRLGIVSYERETKWIEV